MAAGVRIFRISKHMLQTSTVCKHFKRHVTLCASPTVFITSQLSGSASKQKSKMASNMAANKEQIPDKFKWLKDHVPCFGMNGDDITVINQPVDFYETFKSMTQNAKRRIIIASLYLGTSILEQHLVESIEEACCRSIESGNENFEVHILLDYTRGSRGVDKSSRTMLTPLLEKYKNRVNVYLYHTPDLRGLLKQYVPERFNETLGLNHMKIYLADDDCIISGANLSDNYFTNRQDRYIQFCHCPEMTDYLTDLVKAVSQFSFHLQSDNTTIYPSTAPHPYLGSDPPSVFKDFARKSVLDVTQTYLSKSSDKLNSRGSTSAAQKDNNVDTWLFPLIQMGPFKINDDEKVTELLFRQSESGDKILLASGYFNLTSQYIDVVLNQSKASFDILTAAPEANGFYGSRGISGYIPAAYTYIARQFYSEVCTLCQEGRIVIHEYFRPHWTFHCKGLWYYLPNATTPIFTLIGSPNFGYRSVYKDLECQVAVVTNNTALQQNLKQEHEQLYECSTHVSQKTFDRPERYVPLWVTVVTNIIKKYF